jgi:hypothetical protein
MEKIKMLSVHKRALFLRATLAVVCALGLSSRVAAGPERVVKGAASGSITFRDYCSPTELCQESTVAGQATQLGNFVGTLSERVDLNTGNYTGTGFFTTANGDTLSTAHTGSVRPSGQDGAVFFTETHEIVTGTGRFAGATGSFHVEGTADAAGAVSVVIQGSITK